MIILTLKEKVPFFWELAQHTLIITNSAGKTFYIKNSVFVTFKSIITTYLCSSETIADFTLNENKITLFHIPHLFIIK